MQNPRVLKDQDQPNLARLDSPTQTKIIQHTVEKVSVKKHEGLSPEKLEEIKAKVIQAMKDHYKTNTFGTLPKMVADSSQTVGEEQISHFLSDNNIDHVTHDNTIITNLELDIYIPSLRLAIEYCGLYWHSEQMGKGKHYHKNKHDQCKKQGVQLLTIYEDEWYQRTEQVKRKLLHLAKRSVDKVHARKTTIVKLNTKQKTTFFEENHIQGSGPGSIVYGLKNDNEIVSAMCFIKNSDDSFYLNRYATSINVVGGFSKLLNHFKTNHNWTQIISFADQRWSDGNLYETTGFALDSILPPDYYYSPDGKHRLHKFNYRRKNLPKLLAHFDPALSETVNCNNNGILRIWDCGKRRYVLTK